MVTLIESMIWIFCSNKIGKTKDGKKMKFYDGLSRKVLNCMQFLLFVAGVSISNLFSWLNEMNACVCV